MNVAVDPDLRRLGVAARMVERMLDEAGRDERYTLEVRVSNHAAIAMYEKLGFVAPAAAAATTATTARTR